MKSDKPDKIEHLSPVLATRGATVGPVCDDVQKDERVSTRQAKERFVAMFERVGGSSVSLATQQAGISRDTFYRWLHEDKEFKEVIEHTKYHLNDLVEDILMLKILQGDGPSVRFYLSRKHPGYKTHKETYFYQTKNSGGKTLEDLLDNYQTAL
ncbi:MAG: hypothetical protein WC461_00795 [Candidatus Paceibacterota bacterium]